ncbi:MAG: hypothetical protein E6Q06_01610 [Candidatus Moraniibacteriota bacterium]|nr:MAG: hypothetical protein E6Q06_01610 [Candidatus Moranbacteria bacterium]
MTGITSNEEGVAIQSSRRRAEGEIAMLQSDRSRLERRSNELDAEIRAIEKSIDSRTLELDSQKAARSRLIQRIQDIDADILRKKRESFSKKQ